MAAVRSVLLGALLLGGAVGCVEHSLTLTLKEDGSGRVRTTLLTDLPLADILQRDPDLKDSIVSAWPAAAGEATLTNITAGELQGFTLEAPIASLPDLQAAWPIFIHLVDPTQQVYQVQLLSSSMPATKPGVMEAKDYPLPPTLFEAAITGIISNAFPHAAPATVKGALHGLSFDYTMHLPGRILETNGRQAGNTIRWQCDLDDTPLDSVASVLNNFEGALPYARIRVTTWPVDAFRQEHPAQAETTPWPQARVTPAQNTNGASLAVYVDSANFTRRKGRQSAPAHGELETVLLLVYRNPERIPAAVDLKSLLLDGPDTPSLRPDVVGGWMARAWKEQKDGAWTVRRQLKLRLNHTVPVPVTATMLGGSVTIESRSTEPDQVLTIPGPGYYVISCDGTRPPRLDPDPLLEGKGVLTNQAFIRGIDDASHQRVKAICRKGGWRRATRISGRPERYKHSVDRNQPLALTFPAGKPVNESFTFEFPELVLP